MNDQRRFGRAYELIIGIPNEILPAVVPFANAQREVKDGLAEVDFNIPLAYNEDFSDFTNVPSTFYSVTDLDMKATINQNKTTGTPCTIEVSNLDELLIDKIEKDVIIILRAGYKNNNSVDENLENGLDELDLGDLFVGQVAQATTSNNKTTRTTSIICAEGITVRKNSRVSYSWPAGTLRKKVLDDLIKMYIAQGIPLGRLILSEGNFVAYGKLEKPFLTGYSIEGNLVTEMDKFCSGHAMKSYVSLGRLYVEPKILNLEEGIVVNVVPENIIGEIGKVSDSTGNPSNENNEGKNSGIQLSVFLDSRITTDQFLDLRGVSDNYDGTYKIDSVKHILDYTSNRDTWKTIINATKVL